jgi:Arc/MetJ-type ribon-helix-helix transcriptional regulator
MGSSKLDKVITVRLPHVTSSVLTELVREGFYPGITEAARSLMVRSATSFAAHAQSVNPKRIGNGGRKRKGQRLLMLSIRVNDTILDLIDMLIDEGYFISRAEAARYFIIRGAIDMLSSIRSAMSDGGENNVR